MLYLIKSGKYIKIGYTQNLEKRLKEYSTHNPDYEILDTRKGTRSDETYLHKLLSKYRVDKTEWFSYSNYIIKVFKEYKPYKLDQEYAKNIITFKYIKKLLSSNDKLKKKRLKQLINEGKLVWKTNKNSSILVWN